MFKPRRQAFLNHVKVDHISRYGTVPIAGAISVAPPVGLSVHDIDCGLCNCPEQVMRGVIATNTVDVAFEVGGK